MTLDLNGMRKRVSSINDCIKYHLKMQELYSFEDARTVFLDENAIRFFDPDHSENEDRFLMIGMSFTLRLLIVSHCHRENDSVIRIISARKADKLEQSEYWR